MILSTGDLVCSLVSKPGMNIKKDEIYYVHELLDDQSIYVKVGYLETLAILFSNEYIPVDYDKNIYGGN